ncbi:hypothetical protein V6N12_007496 [Hibiscus sabdariffa]|uniref:DUF4283 domain-containing protein n=1 Tax=Hibiscus sabdariffa TaxID=183260 RepID=A0ABR2F212_9ROSI
MDDSRNDSKNPKNARWHDDEPPDIGCSLSPTKDPPSPLCPPASINLRPSVSYKDSLMGESNGNHAQDDILADDDDIEILEGEVTRIFINGLISIQFSELIQSLAAKSMDRTIVLKLLGRCIGYEILKTKIHKLWKPAHEIKLLDIENGYFLATFRSHEDFLTILTDGPWTIFGHYLTIEPWSPDFSPSQPYPSKVVAWIRLLGLPATLYKWSQIKEIGNCTGPAVRIDYQTESGCHGRFARMAIQIDLNTPLISKLIVNGKLQVIEYDEVAGGSRFNPLVNDPEDTQVDGNVANPVQANTSAPLVPPPCAKEISLLWPSHQELSTSGNPSSLLSTIILLSLGLSRRPSDTSNRDIPPSRKNGHVMGDPPDSDMELLPTPLLLGLGHE